MPLRLLCTLSQKMNERKMAVNIGFENGFYWHYIEGLFRNTSQVMREGLGTPMKCATSKNSSLNITTLNLLYMFNFKYSSFRIEISILHNNIKFRLNKT